jgi:hypothetical protein
VGWGGQSALLRSPLSWASLRTAFL